MKTPLGLLAVRQATWGLALGMIFFGLPLAVHAQSGTATCPTLQDITPAHLYGHWQLNLGTIERPQGEGQLVFESHPEFPGSFRGTLTRQTPNGPYNAWVAGDVTDDGFQLEESVDGVSIDAVWTGDVVPGSCGRTIDGWRRVAEGHASSAAESEVPFRLSKTPGWQ